MARIKLETEVFEELLKRVEKAASGDLEKVVEKALKVSAESVTPKLEKGIARHVETGSTKESLRKNTEVKWDANTAYIQVGFDINNGGLASVFLIFGTPHMKKDTTLYNALYSKKAIKDRAELQKKTVEEYLGEMMNGK